MSCRIDYKMKKYYYITFIAIVATVCLQAKYIWGLYNQYVTENIIKIEMETEKAIEDEKWIRRVLQSIMHDTYYRGILIGDKVTKAGYCRLSPQDADMIRSTTVKQIAAGKFAAERIMGWSRIFCKQLVFL